MDHSTKDHRLTVVVQNLRPFVSDSMGKKSEAKFRTDIPSIIAAGTPDCGVVSSPLKYIDILSKGTNLMNIRTRGIAIAVPRASAPAKPTSITPAAAEHPGARATNEGSVSFSLGLTELAHRRGSLVIAEVITNDLLLYIRLIKVTEHPALKSMEREKGNGSGF